MFDKLERDFSRRVEEYVMSNNCGYLDAVVDISEEMNIEPQLAAKYISKPIKERLRIEGEQINLLPKTPKLW
jgi:hypothetical protein